MIYVCNLGSWPSTYTSVANVANVSRIQVSDSNHWAGAITVNLSVSFCLGNFAILLVDYKKKERLVHPAQQALSVTCWADQQSIDNSARGPLKLMRPHWEHKQNFIRSVESPTAMITNNENFKHQSLRAQDQKRTALLEFKFWNFVLILAWD